MVRLHSINLMFIIAFSIWGLVIFAFQRGLQKTKFYDSRMPFSGVYLASTVLLNCFLLSEFLSPPFFSASEYSLLYTIFMLITAVFIFIFNSPRGESKLRLSRLIISLIILISGVIVIAANGISIEHGSHGYFSLFLISEVIHMLARKTLEREKKAEKRVFIAVYLVIVGINTLDLFTTDIFLLYGAWVLPFILPFFFIYKYSELNKELQAEVVSLNEMNKKERESYESSIYMIVNMLESKNDFLKGHSEKVSLYATLIGNRVGLNSGELEELQTAALLHDIGYVGIAIEEYSNRRVINSEDFMRIKRHPKIGADILRKSSQFSQFSDYVLFHHENWDGTGYPNGISGKQIPLFSRIIQIADTYDALTTDRFYRAALSREDAMIILRTGKGTDYDPELVDVFIKCIEVKK
ncbi:MAG: hypothetical protein A2Y33_08380 [Spirochaetes bacterium GWF1_51_8]|nr:MAG: hypothetical protein A2Y33_08380 [Spirochaetes bacterium GWF1_51_8]